MKNLKDLAELAVQISKEPVFNGPYSDGHGRLHTPFETAEKAIEQHLDWFLNDLFKMLKNIKETSINENDKNQRLVELEKLIGTDVKLFI